MEECGNQTGDTSPEMEFHVRSEETVAEAVVRALSTASQREPQTLPALSPIIDPAELNAICARCQSFTYHDCSITVIDETRITLQPPFPTH